MKLRVLVHLEGKELVAQCLEYDVSARASTFAMLRRTFQLNFTARVLLAKDHLSDGETAKIPVERWQRDGLRKAFPLADLMKIGKFIVEFSIL